MFLLNFLEIFKKCSFDLDKKNSLNTWMELRHTKKYYIVHYVKLIYIFGDINYLIMSFSGWVSESVVKSDLVL